MQIVMSHVDCDITYRLWCHMYIVVSHTDCDVTCILWCHMQIVVSLADRDATLHILGSRLQFIHAALFIFVSCFLQNFFIVQYFVCQSILAMPSLLT